jgi:hypothetical protein
MGLVLLDFHLLAVSTVISEAEGCEGFENFGHLKLDWFIKYRSFKVGILESKNIEDKIVV